MSNLNEHDDEDDEVKKTSNGRGEISDEEKAFLISVLGACEYVNYDLNGVSKMSSRDGTRTCIRQGIDEGFSEKQLSHFLPSLKTFYRKIRNEYPELGLPKWHPDLQARMDEVTSDE